MRFDIITIFPKIFDSYFSESILARARKKKLIKIQAHDLRKWAGDKHKKVDDSPYGGGPGMVMKVDVIFKAVMALRKCLKNKSSLCRSGLDPESRILDSRPSRICDFRGNDKRELSLKQRVILFSAKGKTFTQADARRLAKYDQLILICGRYEGVDERVAEHIADEELSVGNFVLTGGEIPAMIVVDSVSRLMPGVLGKEESLCEESFSNNPTQPPLKLRGGAEGLKLETDKLKSCYLEYPQYTRPEEFKGWKVPEVLLGGNHQEIKEWRKNNSQFKKIKIKR